MVPPIGPWGPLGCTKSHLGGPCAVRDRVVETHPAGWFRRFCDVSARLDRAAASPQGVAEADIRGRRRRGAARGCAHAGPLQHPAHGLQGDGLARRDGEDGPRANRLHHDCEKRDATDGPGDGQELSLERPRRVLRGLRQLARAAARRRLPRGVPAGRRHELHRVCAGQPRRLDLVRPAVVELDPATRRRGDVHDRAGRHLRLAQGQSQPRAAPCHSHRDLRP